MPQHKIVSRLVESAYQPCSTTILFGDPLKKSLSRSFYVYYASAEFQGVTGTRHVSVLNTSARRMAVPGARPSDMLVSSIRAAHDNISRTVVWAVAFALRPFQRKLCA